MTMLGYSWLDEGLIQVDAGRGREQVSLPGLLERLGREDALELCGLQRHHHSPVYSFLVQTAALALLEGEDPGPRKPAESWRTLLLALTDGAIEPWCLFVEDPELPAFLQPPPGKPGQAREGLDSLKPPVFTPEAIDILVTAKNHDVKSARFSTPRPEDWIYTLIALQTSQGYSGRDNPGIARMNGGFASRASFSAAPSRHWPARFRRDVKVWLEDREAQLQGVWGYRPEGGKALLWLEPWDGTESLELSQLDPFFVEVCRRVRLVGIDDSLGVRLGTSKVPRIAAKELKGYLGDPFVPIRKSKKDIAALTVSASGFSYRLVSDLLLSDGYTQPAALEVRGEDGDEPVLIARVLARGQGQTSGYHERVIPLPKKVVRSFSNQGDRKLLGRLAKERIEKVRDVQRRVLRPAICALLQGGRDQLDLRDAGAVVWLDRLDRRVDRVFFDHLWEDVDQHEEEQLRRWHALLKDLATELFEQALDSVPIPLARGFRAVATARSRFDGGLRKQLPAAFVNSSELKEEVA